MAHNSKQGTFQYNTGTVADPLEPKKEAALETTESLIPPQPNASQSTNLPQAATRAHPQFQQQLGNAGMAAGATAGVISGGALGSPVGDMVMGGVVGGIVGQKIAQAQNHAFWREKAVEYREGRAAGTIPPPDATADGPAPSWFSKEGRAERRAERWERRAKRRDGLE